VAADAEAAAVAAVHDRAMLLPSTTASAATVLDAADGSALLHVAAHGELRADNPLFSALRLSDGPLTILDLERLANPPRHVVLAACEAARAQPTVGEEVLGLGAALLRAGTTDVVAPVLPVPDDATQPVMVGLHEQLRAGVPVAAALAAVQHDLASRRDVLAAAAAAFVCLGYGQGTL
jgi:CHAT domain-containing protein